MTTVTGLTADRMLAIEAASVVSGIVDGSGNLILTKHDGSQINAGPVTGPPGPQGPVGSDLAVLSQNPVLEVGLANQIRAGRQLSPADFANIGLSAPLGLWNLSDLSDASGNGRALLNKGAVPFGVGINGLANTAASFVGNTGQALYIPDTGSNDPFRIKNGSWGCWFRSAKIYSTIGQYPISKVGASGSWAVTLWQLYVVNGVMGAAVGDGSTGLSIAGSKCVTDDLWHFLVATYDGTQLRLYVDGVQDGSLYLSLSSINQTGVAPLNIGAFGGDGSTAAVGPTVGRVDEAFVTSDVLSEEQIRLLYCAKIAHTLGAVPSRSSITIRRRRRGAALSPSDFPAAPLRLHNFSGGSVADEGSNNIPLVAQGGVIFSSAGVDGSAVNAYTLYGGGGGFASTDAGLPAGVTSRSYGAWFKSNGYSSSIVLMAWGTISTADSRIILSGNPLGVMQATSGADSILAGPPLPNGADGQWHFIVVTEDNGALDGFKRKMYMDGVCIGLSQVMNPITLAGANKFRVGAHQDGSNMWVGQIDSAFVCGYALTGEQIQALYAKGSQALAPSPKDTGDHIEALSSTDILATFDTLDSTAQVSLKVAA